MSRPLVEALGADRGIVSIVGAGGKKTTLYALAAAHPGRVGVTTTVFMAKFSRRLGGHEIVSAVPDLSQEIAVAGRRNRIVAWARPSDKPGRVGGVTPGEVLAAHDAGGFDVTLVKADGARMRAIKAPEADEPVPADGTTLVVPLVSAAAFGRPLNDTIAHRPERIAAVTGLQPNATITPEAVGILLASENGALKDIGDARVVPIINAVDDARLQEAAERTARAALDATDRFERVVLTSHRRRQEPLVDIIERE
ncbi:MAG: selenium cofactor biosynthesis protein YqeC [Halofilum sp. (in: g-proteobacteria)]|nr:selenium cofactor biosynthesis protein YqeC [Halofilum sp. (in: g-proteobacteria)]